jgi:hypothetical protein
MKEQEMTELRDTRGEKSWVRARKDGERFAARNGWRRAGVGFTFRRLARMPVYARGMLEADAFPCWGGGDLHHVMDHIWWFNMTRRPVAIVSMLYHPTREGVDEITQRYGLEVQVPPIERSGWWLPGWTYCFAFVRPGTKVCWLPEQCSTQLAQQAAEMAEIGLRAE